MVIATVLAAFSAAFSGYFIFSGKLSDDAMERREECREDFGTVGFGVYADCVAEVNTFKDMWYQIFGYSLGIALLSPTIFFGGVGLYGYLFPMGREDSNEGEKAADEGGHREVVSG